MYEERQQERAVLADMGLLMARPFLVASLNVESSILVMMMARRVGFVTVTSALI